jgi:hypothetical protein
MCTPLTTEVATTSWGLEPFEKEWKMETHSRFHTLNGNNGTRANITETEIITSMPDEIFANIEDVHKDIRNNTKLIRVKTKENMTAGQRRTSRGGKKH